MILDSDGDDPEEFRLVGGCLSLYHHHVRIPDCLQTITLHLIDLGGPENIFIAGLTFRGIDGSSTTAGYLSPKQMSIIIVGQLQGLSLAIDSRGIRAIKFHTSKSDRSSDVWVGNPHDCPKTERLAFSSGRVSAVDVGFDGCKITSLAAVQGLGAAQQTQGNLASAALWYPEVPPASATLQNLELADNRYFTNSKYYAPLVWAHFGGQRGESLRNLVSITFTVNKGIMKMTFGYNSLPDLTLGRHVLPLHEYWELPPAKFIINGPGGEFITGVDVSYSMTERQGYQYALECDFMRLRAVKVYTNYGRSRTFKARNADKSGWSVQRFRNTSENTRITGFYTRQRPDRAAGFTGLGVVLETV
ncbi:unnamed protein product [Clonostachys rosea]|uniref:DUF7600 domain-containing protein n=1 Tax=Bionectria ochroleuca TaxID=29856 RepID=A0ABY6V138_BIOOC|nr:unnamed protein product [Clonostachys rosea]